MDCELCGTRVDSLTLIKVDKAEFRVCEACKLYGQIVETAPPEAEITSLHDDKSRISQMLYSTPHVESSADKQRASSRTESKPLTEKVVVSNCAQLVRTARQKRDLKQEELAKQLNEKISVIQAVETGRHSPDLKLAAKLARFFGVRLIEEV